MNATRFIANPFGEPGSSACTAPATWSRWVRRNRQLELEYLGRSDFQVKIRGLRIELGEIDAVLVADPEIAYAATLGVKGPSGATVLVSYVLAEADINLDIERLRNRVATKLPGYMVPSLIIVLDEIPLTPVGKLDRKALPVPDFRARPQSTYLAPRTPSEQTVCEVFEAVLGFEGIGIDESFFDLGGNSLLATRVIARINSTLGSSIALRDLFDAPTAAQLTSRISPTGVGSRAQLVARSRPDRIPLSLAQQRMWFVNQLDPTSGAYNIAMALRLTGDLNVEAFEAALGDLVARHESLRTVFPGDAAGARQVIIAPEAATPVLRAVRVTELRTAVEELAGSGIDVSKRTPLRAALFRVDTDDPYFRPRGPSHRRRRRIDRPARRRPDDRLRRPPARLVARSRTVGGAVCRLRAVAAGSARRRHRPRLDRRPPDGVLADQPRRSSRSARPPDRSTAPAGAVDAQCRLRVHDRRQHPRDHARRSRAARTHRCSCSRMRHSLCSWPGWAPPTTSSSARR